MNMMFIKTERREPTPLFVDFMAFSLFFLANGSAESVVEDDANVQGSRALDAAASGVGEQGLYALYVETLSCESFYDPGSSTVPFAYPPSREHLTSCRSAVPKLRF